MKCLICKKDFKVVTNTHLGKHDLTPVQYKEMFPDEKLVWGHAITGKGKPAWNTGLTKESDDRIKGGRNRIHPIASCKICGKDVKKHGAVFCSFECCGKAKSLGIIKNSGMFAVGYFSPKKNRTYKEMYGERADGIIEATSLSHTGLVGFWRGKSRPEETRIKISDRVKDNLLNDRFPLSKGKNCWSKAGYRGDIGHFVRSRWEANFCRILKTYEIEYEYESKACRFNLDELGVLIIDLYLPEKDLYIEIKGRLVDSSKLKRFVEKYPNISLKIIDSESYGFLEKKYGKVIQNWERKGVMPVEPAK
jgi:hypothetical protein